MGNCQSLQDSVDIKWRFVGRDKDLESCMDLLFKKKKKSVLVFGMKKIGKSRFIEELYKLCKGKKCIWKDFELDNLDSGHTLYSWFIEFLTCINARKEKERFENAYPSETIACNSCINCKQPNRDKCIVRNDLINKATNALIDALGKYESEIVLFLDNIDKIMDCPELRDCFLDFYDKSVELAMLQTVLTSANKPKLTTRGYASFELKPLDNTAILELLFEMTEERENNSEEEKEHDGTVKYSLEFQVFTPGNEPYIKAIVGLCDGLPLAAAMAGLLLTEDDGLLTPADLVEILIHMRRQALSPENCSPDERLDIYTEQMKKIVDDVALFFHCLNEKMTGSHFSIDEAVEAASAGGDNAATGAMVKHNRLKPGLDRSILSMQKLQGKQKLKWHGILRECHAALQATDGVDSAKDMILKFMKENAKNAGLDLDEETLCDPTFLALAIRRLANQVEPSSPVQAIEDCEKERMSLLKEHEVASKMVATTKFDAEQSSVLKVHEEVEPHKDVENSLPSEPGKAKKLATRYSVSEGSDSSDSDSVNLQFTNIDLRQTEESMMNDSKETSETRSEQTTGDNYSTSPPPYTSRPGSSEARTAPYHNQNAGNAGMVMRQSDKADAISSPHKHAHTNTRMQASNQQIAELKEPISDMPVEVVFVRSGFSTQGPEDIPYKMLHSNDLHVNQENFSQVSHTSSVKTDHMYSQVAQTGEMPKHHGQSFGSRLSINHSVHESNPKRLSLTAVIRPMSKRRSPPNVDKQLPNEGNISNAGPSEPSDMI